MHVVPQQSLSPFARLLTQADADGSYEAVMDRLKEMGPSSIDLELQSLGPEWGGSVDLVRSFMVFLQHAFKTNKNFELAQAYLGLLLKVSLDSDTTSNCILLFSHVLHWNYNLKSISNSY